MHLGRVNFQIGGGLDGKQPFAAFSFIDSAEFEM